MAVSEAQQKAVNKYVKNNYDRINVTFPKGKKSIIQAHVSTTGESVNAFINRAVAETMERDSSLSSPALKDSQVQNSVPQTEPQPVPEGTDLPNYLTQDILAHIDRSKFAHDTAYQIEIGKIIGMDHLSDFAAFLKQQQ
ncbi:MAG: hypothetical protein SO445_03565 [Lachnospiraceae bacterium]|nr:hypothetical protein [Lachnospiraceae bacterium]